ncbi:hypothetical protein INT44_004716 [Umbelopsis vinacea]|uniref:Arrestin C-terminal-like domain-containing protein n=1 Tax=Umbelopsis vinacea TaxID=44442 RepID=A0A8H7PFZ1_9FUNG|nr:hypothetical protein INT44_004716 [Umbelopsis vinacea]
MNSPVKLSIDLLPEFGWRINGEPVYSPGSIFEGSVKVDTATNIPQATIKILFVGTEKLRPDVAAISGVMLEQRPIFAVRSILFGKEGPQDIPSGKQQYHFAIQLPMVNYPPTFVHSMCSCSFRLIAVLESNSTQRVYSEQSIRYIPYIETSPLKDTYALTAHGSSISVPSLSYLQSDTIPIHYESKNSPVTSVTVKLRRRLTYGDDGVEDHLDETLASEEIKLTNTLNGTVYFNLPESIIPTIDYSSWMSMTYSLEVTVRRQKRMGTAAHFMVPLTIGTMGPGIRTPSDLKPYNQFKEAADTSRRVVPCFVQRIEYEDCLPEYASYKLPNYQNSSDWAAEPSTA